MDRQAIVDSVTRVLSQILSERYGQKVTVEAK